MTLSEDEIVQRLTELDGWTRDGAAISRSFTATFDECAHIAMYVAAKARELDHHPDIDIRWQRITFTISTHYKGPRLTSNDFELARHIDAIATALGAEPVTAD